MRVLCEHKEWNNTLAARGAIWRVGDGPGSDALKVGNIYTVYAVELSIDRVSRLVLCTPTLWFYPVYLFGVSDPRISRFWRATQLRGNGASMLLLGPEDLSGTPETWDAVLSREPAAMKDFDRIRALMDLEFADGTVDRTAIALGDCWVQCPFCAEAWEAVPGLEMTKCSSCGKALLLDACVPK